MTPKIKEYNIIINSSSILSYIVPILGDRHNTSTLTKSYYYYYFFLCQKPKCNSLEVFSINIQFIIIIFSFYTIYTLCTRFKCTFFGYNIIRVYPPAAIAHPGSPFESAICSFPLYQCPFRRHIISEYFNNVQLHVGYLCG